MKEFLKSDMAYEMQNEDGFSSCKTEPLGNHITRSCQFFGGSKRKECVRTYFIPSLWTLSEANRTEIVRVISTELNQIFMKHCLNKQDEIHTVLTVGLGNRELTPDSLGPETVKRILATRAFHYEKIIKKSYEVACLAPDVFVNTGIETYEIVKSVAEQIQPRFILVVDALVAKSCSTLGAAIQISELGIRPGSGLGAARQEISFQTMGIPVISLGIPTVVRSSALIAEALEYQKIRECTEEMRQHLRKMHQYFVSPKEIDIMIREASFLLASIINRSCNSIEA